MAGRFRERRLSDPILFPSVHDSAAGAAGCSFDNNTVKSPFFPDSHRPCEAEKKDSYFNARFPDAARLPASLTVEAALVLPLFLLLCSLFFTFFSGQYWQLKLQQAMDEVCEDVAVWSYLLDFADDYTGADLLALADGGHLSGALEGRGDDIAQLLSGQADLLEEIRLFLLEKGSALLWQPLLEQWIIAKVGREALRASPIVDRDEGLSLAGSTLHDRELDLVLRYEIVALRYGVIQRSCRRLWIGTRIEKPHETDGEPEEEEESEEEVYYVTAFGSVYHTTKSCRVLALKIMTVDYASLPSLRNTSGGKYYACDRCAKHAVLEGTTVIVTEPGTRYHFRSDCPSLKRTITEISVSEAKEKYRPCHYCGGNGA